MARSEWPALAGLVGAIYCMLPNPAMWRYVAIYGGGALVAYSLIPYKTPWCIASILWPFYLLFGAFAEKLRPHWLGRGLAGLLIAVSVVMCVRLNFFRHFGP